MCTYKVLAGALLSSGMEIGRGNVFLSAGFGKNVSRNSFYKLFEKSSKLVALLLEFSCAFVAICLR